MKHLIKYLIDFSALALLYIFAFFPKWQRRGRDVLLVNTLMLTYLSGVLYFTLMPIITALPFILDHPYSPMNLVPFIDVSLGRGDFVRQIVLNVVMTIPFGFLFPLTRERTPGFGKTVLFCFLMSLGIELLQPLLHGYKSSDITDLITNVSGGIAGYGAYRIFRPITFRILDHLRSEKGR